MEKALNINAHEIEKIKNAIYSKFGVGFIYWACCYDTLILE